MDVLHERRSRTKKRAWLVARRSAHSTHPNGFRPKVNFGKSVTYSFDYARRLKAGDTALLLEFPFAAAPSKKVESADVDVIKNLATLFVTPS